MPSEGGGLSTCAVPRLQGVLWGRPHDGLGSTSDEPSTAPCASTSSRSRRAFTVDDSRDARQVKDVADANVCRMSSGQAADWWIVPNDVEATGVVRAPRHTSGNSPRDGAAEEVLRQMRVDEMWGRVVTAATETFRLTRRRDQARERGGDAECAQAEEQLANQTALHRSCVDAYVQVCNLAALRLLNERHFSFALHVLLRAQEVVQPGAGRWFRYARDDPTDVSIRDNAEDTHWGRLHVPYYTPAHESRRRRACAVVDNNVGLYHFHLAEYDLACDRLARAAVAEEWLGADSLGITYFNLAQAQYRLDPSTPQRAMDWLRLAAAAVERRVVTAGGTGTSRRGAAATAAWLRWRDAVNLLTRVQAQLGAWLRQDGQYAAAARAYDEAIRWQRSVGALSPDERARVGRMTRHVQACRHAQRRRGKLDRCVSHVDAVPGRVVTSLLPRYVEVIDTVMPRPASCSDTALPPRPRNARRAPSSRPPPSRRDTMTVCRTPSSAPPRAASAVSVVRCVTVVQAFVRALAARRVVGRRSMSHARCSRGSSATGTRKMALSSTASYHDTASVMAPWCELDEVHVTGDGQNGSKGVYGGANGVLAEPPFLRSVGLTQGMAVLPEYLRLPRTYLPI